MKYTLGTGTLGWTSFERHTDRYGAVHLNYGEEGRPTFEDAPVGKVGTLSVKVIEVLHPLGKLLAEDLTQPKAGEVVLLGEGELFTEEYNPDLRTVGVKPLDGREENWLDSMALLRCHFQLVELVFEAES